MDLVEAGARGHDAAVRHPWETARVEVVRSLIRRHVRLAPEAIVMDIGCGDTYVAEQLSADHRDATFYAIDTAFTEDLIGRYRARLNNPRVLPFKSLDAMRPPPAKPVSLVLLMDVLEHIEDDRGFLGALLTRPFIGRDTRFLITVPAYQSLFCSHDRFLGHYRRYTNRLLRTLVNGSGLQVVEIGYFFWSLLPLRVLQVLKERTLKASPPAAESGLTTWHGGSAQAAVLRSALLFDWHVSRWLHAVGIRAAGLSNYAICATSA